MLSENISPARPRPQAHAAERWALVVVRGADSADDPRTMQAWGGAVGVSTGCLKTWCKAAGVLPKDSLNLCRVLRSIAFSIDEGWYPYNLLDIIDSRTLSRFFKRFGISDSAHRPPLSMFLYQQQHFFGEANIVAVERLLRKQSRFCTLLVGSKSGRLERTSEYPLGNELIAPKTTLRGPDPVRCCERLGGVLRFYYREAA